jgi:hypothetical protein
MGGGCTGNYIGMKLWAEFIGLRTVSNYGLCEHCDKAWGSLIGWEFLSFPFQESNPGLQVPKLVIMCTEFFDLIPIV